MSRRSARTGARRVSDVRDFVGSPAYQLIFWLTVVKIVGIVLLFDPLGEQVFDLPKSLFSRAFEWLLAGALILALLRYGRAIVPRTRLHVAVAVFLATHCLSGLVAENRYIAAFGEPARYLGLTFQVDMAVLYAAVAVSFRRSREWALAAAALGAAAVLASAYAFAQRVGVDPIDWRSDVAIRPFGTFGNPDMFGHFLSVTLALALAVAVLAPRKISLAAVAVLGVGLAAVAVAATRGTMLGLGAAIVALAGAYVRVRGGTLARRELVGGTAAAVAVMAVLLLATPVGQRTLGTLQGAGTAGRLVLWESALRAAIERPVLGFGPDGFGVAYPHVRQPGSAAVLGLNTTQNAAHSWPLQAAATTGLVGLAATVAILASVGTVLWRALPNAPRIAGPLLVGYAAYWAHALVAVGSIGVDWYPWLAAGGAAALAGGPPTTRTSRPIHPLGYTLVALAALGGALLGAAAFDANRAAHAAHLAWTADAAPAALAAARVAVERDAGRPDHWNWLGLAHELDSDWRAAGEAYGEATRRVPHDAQYWRNLALTRSRQALAGDLRSGGPDAALAAAQRGVEADPRNPVAHATLAEVADAFGREDVALEAAVDAMEMLSTTPAYDAIAVRAATSDADLQRAREGLERALRYRDSALLRIGVARVALKQNDLEAARRNARRALELDPSSAEARDLLRRAGG